MNSLIADIVTGARQEGEMLPREVDLAQQFDVSRGVARETIRALEERGLVTVKHGRGATVNESGRWNVFDPDVLGVLLAGNDSDRILAEYLECRRILEVEAAGLAAERADAEQLEELRTALGRMEESAKEPATGVNERAYHEADIAFHQTSSRRPPTAPSPSSSAASTRRCCWPAFRWPGRSTATPARSPSTGGSSRRSPPATPTPPAPR